MTYLLDNNVLTELWKGETERSALVWACWQHVLHKEDWLVPVPVIAEIQEGAESDPSAKRKAQIISRLDAFTSGHGEFILDWDAQTARTWGRLKHSAEVKRQPQPLWDSLIDAMAVRHDFTVATRNRKDFRHADTFSPWNFVARKEKD